MSCNQKSKADATSVPLRICFVDHAGVLGGAELCLLDIAAHFAARGKVILFIVGIIMLLGILPVLLVLIYKIIIGYFKN